MSIITPVIPNNITTTDKVIPHIAPGLIVSAIRYAEPNIHVLIFYPFFGGGKYIAFEKPFEISKSVLYVQLSYISCSTAIVFVFMQNKVPAAIITHRISLNRTSIIIALNIITSYKNDQLYPSSVLKTFAAFPFGKV